MKHLKCGYNSTRLFDLFLYGRAKSRLYCETQNAQRRIKLPGETKATTTTTKMNK